MTPITLLTGILVPLGLYMAFVFFKDFWPMWCQHRRDIRNLYGNHPQAKKHPKSEWRQFTQEEKDELDDFLTPYRFPEAIKLDEHEKALA